MSHSNPRIYLVRAGGDGEDENFALEHGVAIIGFSEYPRSRTPRTMTKFVKS